MRRRLWSLVFLRNGVEIRVDPMSTVDRSTGQESTGRADRPKLQLGHLAERRRYPGRRAPEVNGHATGVDSDDSTQAMRIVRDKVVERVLLDNRVDVRCERTAGEMRAPAPGDDCHCAVSMRPPRLPGDPLNPHLTPRRTTPALQPDHPNARPESATHEEHRWIRAQRTVMDPPPSSDRHC